MTGGRINGLDLFSGTGGISIALEPWVRTVAYCEQSVFCQGVLLSRMANGSLDRAPIWDDVRTLRGTHIPEPVDIVFGGFPCQDISPAGTREGLGGKRSALYWEVWRLVGELRPTFVFLENVAAIRTRGLAVVARSLAGLGYDLRWDVLSAEAVGAPHRRQRWFLLGYSADAHRLALRHRSERGSGRRTGGVRSEGQALAGLDREERNVARSAIVPDPLRGGQPEIRDVRSRQPELGGTGKDVPDADRTRREADRTESDPTKLAVARSAREVRQVADAQGFGLEPMRDDGDASLQRTHGQEDAHHRGREVALAYAEGLGRTEGGTEPTGEQGGADAVIGRSIFDPEWWAVEPDVGRVVNGPSYRLDHLRTVGGFLVDPKTGLGVEAETLRRSFRSDRLHALGNGVVPFQVRTIFKHLMGIT